MSNPPDDEYATALGYLYSRVNYELTAPIPDRASDLNLEKMHRLLAGLKDPHRRLPIVHIAGTKGKGSTAAMISSVLMAAGYRVGLYTSPHLSRLEERFAVNGVPCSRRDLIEMTGIVRTVVEQLDLAANEIVGRPTFFEITTAMGLLHFARQQVDIVVLEVGLGGRLDATNVCRPIACVITSISFDHTQQLGNTLALIAAEKAGIIKPGVPVVSGVVEAEPADVIARVAHDRGCQISRRDHEFFIEYQPPHVRSPAALSFRVNLPTSDWSLGAVRLGMLGRHQAINAGVALATLDRLKALGWSISDDACRCGLAGARCPARIEILSRRPTVILDTAHNLASTQALVATLDESFPPDGRILIFGAARDKDVAGMLRQLLPTFEHAILTQFRSNPRGLPLEKLTELARNVADELPGSCATLHSAATPELAWQRWLERATPESLVCIAGSFFLAAEFQRMFPAIRSNLGGDPDRSDHTAASGG